MDAGPFPSIRHAAHDLTKAPGFVLGPLSVDPSARRIGNGERSEMLEPRVMRVLVALGGAHGKVLSRDDLIDFCWDGTIVGENAIKRVIFRLRHALDDLSGGAVSLETITKVGFRLVYEPVAAETVPTPEPVPTTLLSPAPSRPAIHLKRRFAFAAAFCMALLAMAGTRWWLRPTPAATHSLTVRLAGFQALSTDLPANIRATVNTEIAAAFNADGVVGVSTASAPASGTVPAYALGGTIQRDGQAIRVITHLTNERSGASLWSDTIDYDGSKVSKIPRHIAVNVGNVVRCGLFGASTYAKGLPDAVLRDYMQFCQWHWDTNLLDGRKALVPAQRVVAAVPDFSWGWAAVAGAYWKVAWSAGNARLAEEARAKGREAADRAVAIDSRNSEAMYTKAMIVDRQDWLGKEGLFKRALAARRLDCGCEHHQYGAMLTNVGRLNDAVEQLRQGNEMLALYLYTTLTLADTLVIAGKSEEAKPFFEAAIELAPDSGFASTVTQFKAVTATRDIKALLDPRLSMSAEMRTALLMGYRATESGNAAAKAQAIQALLALREDMQGDAVAWLLADLGATHDAFRIASRSAAGLRGPSIYWHPSMRGTLSDPGFPALATQLGLIDYWKASHTKPDACNEKGSQPPFCRMI